MAITKPSANMLGFIPRGWLSGLGMTYNTTTSLNVAAGQCADSTNSVMLNLSAGSINMATTGANALDTASIGANTWYHCFAIGKPDGTTAFLASTSVSSPTLPSGYTLFRRIGSIRSNGSSQITQFVQNGDTFTWTGGPVVDVNTTAPTSAAVTRTLTVPTGVVVFPIIHLIVYNANGSFSDGVYLSALSTTDVSAATNITQVYANASGYGASVVNNVPTNTSAQIRSRMASGGSNQQFLIATAGWIDSRGKDA